MNYPEDKDSMDWLTAAQENFLEAVSVENWALCRAIVSDVRDIAPDSAVVLERELAEAQNRV